jgi:hypothetical protein
MRMAISSARPLLALRVLCFLYASRHRGAAPHSVGRPFSAPGSTVPIVGNLVLPNDTPVTPGAVCCEFPLNSKRRPKVSLSAGMPHHGFGRCDRRHKLLFEYPIIFWTPRGSLNHFALARKKPRLSRGFEGHLSRGSPTRHLRGVCRASRATYDARFRHSRHQVLW